MASLPQPPDPRPPRVPTVTTASVVGPGRLGTVLSRALGDLGIDVSGPTGHGEPIAAADAVLLCVPDAEIAAAAASARSDAGPGALIGHTSGATPLDDVDFGLHPLQTFVGTETADVFHGIGFGVAGRTPAALATATELAERLGGRAVVIADEDRAAYHAAASIASNYSVTLLAAAEQVAATAGFSAAEARELLAPLVRRTIDNWVADGPHRALTGPVARGDVATVERQRAAVAAVSPDLLPLYDALTAATADLAKGTA
ncbi:DUF2520 domain-containing protein [Microbacterium mangrovi]|uniref:DUF2520 domain-containing protein n=1 Tax=Microbacterium mangrovi TaxID=1348253 RepID=UPI00068DB609|nr:DUF2520 domain-containing protein [Microbacterium mangrovi]